MKYICKTPKRPLNVFTHAGKRLALPCISGSVFSSWPQHLSSEIFISKRSLLSALLTCNWLNVRVTPLCKKKNWKCDSTTATKYAHNPLLVNPVPTLWQNIWQNCNEYCYKLHIWWICDAVGTRTCLKTQHLSWLFKATDPFLTSAPGNTGINLQMSFQ